MIVGKLRLFLSATVIGALVISTIVNIHLYTANKQLNAELSELEFQMYGYTYTAVTFLADETQERASTAWKKVRNLEEAKFVVSEKNFSVIVYIHPYRVGIFDPSSAEWVVIVSSIPEMTNETRIAIFRLYYRTFLFKKAYKFIYPVGKELTIEESVVVMKQEKTRDLKSRGVSRKRVELLGGNYIHTNPAVDFGATIIVNKYAGKVIFYATTVWDGTGKLIIPEYPPKYPLTGPFGPLTMKGDNITVFPTIDAGLTLENVAAKGFTTINKTEIGPDPPSGYKLAEEYYDSKTTADYSGKIEIKIIYEDPSTTQEEALRLMQWNETSQQWIDITTYIDIKSNIIHGETSYLSTFTIVALFPDVTGDDYVGISDIVTVAGYFGTELSGPPNSFGCYYDPIYDINKDDYVGIDDIVETAEHFGETDP